MDNNCRITLDTDVHFISHKYRTPVEGKMNYLKDILEFKQFETNLNIEKYIDKNPVAFQNISMELKKFMGYKFKILLYMLLFFSCTSNNLNLTQYL